METSNFRQSFSSTIKSANTVPEDTKPDMPCQIRRRGKLLASHLHLPASLQISNIRPKFISLSKSRISALVLLNSKCMDRSAMVINRESFLESTYTTHDSPKQNDIYSFTFLISILDRNAF